MGENCFCHLNGYAVKDAVARAKLGSVAYTSCSELGMTAGDSNGENLKILTAAINRGARILVDGLYLIAGKCDAITDCDIIIKGADRNCGFTYSGQAYHVFAISKNVREIDISSVIFDGNPASKVVLFRNDSNGDNDLNIDRMSVRNCKFKNNFSLYKQYGERLLNDSETLSVVKEFLFSHNEITDCDYSFCVMQDVCFNSVEIRYNRINNFKYVAFFFGTTNLSASWTDSQKEKYERLLQNKGTVVARDNIVICDNSCVVSGEEENTGKYYCFLLAECKTAEYKHNHVEGMKASVYSSVYDAYLSCEDVIAENNVWKNNICFASNKQNNALMKAKQGSGVKIYRNNTYTVTEDFLTMLQTDYGADIAKCWVEVVSIVDNSDWEIAGNNISSPAVVKLFGSTCPAARMHFHDNYINAGDYSGGIATKNENAIVTFRNNKYVTETGSTTIKITGVPKAGGSLSVIDNIIIAPLAAVIGNSEYEYDDTYSICENRIECKTAKYFKYGNFAGNKIIAQNADYVVTDRTTDGRTDVVLKLTPNTPCTPLAIEFDSAPATTYLKVRRLYNGGCDVVTLSINVYLDETGSKKVKIVNLDDNTTVYDGDLHPAESASKEVGCLYLSMTPTAAKIQYYSSKVCTFYIERDVVIHGEQVIAGD